MATEKCVKNNFSVVPTFPREDEHSLLSISLWLYLCIYLLSAKPNKVLLSQGVIASVCNEQLCNTSCNYVAELIALLQIQTHHSPKLCALGRVRVTRTVQKRCFRRCVLPGKYLHRYNHCY